MAVKFDAVGAGVTGTAGFNPSINLTESHTSTGRDRAVLVGIASLNGTQAPNTHTRLCTYGGITVPSLIEVDLDTQTFIEIFGLLAQPTGPQTVSVTVTKNDAANTGRQLVFNSVSYTGVKGFGPTASNTGTSTTPALSNVPSSVGEMIFQIFGGLTTQSAYTQTQRYNAIVPANQTDLLIGDALGAALVSFQSTLASSTAWAAADVRLMPVLPSKTNINQAVRRAAYV